MIKLNLPAYTFRIRQGEKGNQIFDIIRKKFVALTPEEWVRQNFIRYIIEEKKYPGALIAVETGLKYNRLKKRSDITVYDKKGKVWMIIECKAPEVSINQAVIEQASRYNHTLKCRHLVITNGIKTFCFEIDFITQGFKQMPDIPRRIL